MDNTRLSHSAVSRYQTCPKSYEFHYVQRWREKTQSAALVFGSALDTALNAILLKTGNPKEVFEAAFTNAKVGNEMVYIPTCEDVVYAASDFDGDLLTNDDRDAISTSISAEDLVEHLKYEKKERGWENLTSGQRQHYNLAHWCVLRQKGFLMIDAYIEKILPCIKEVKAVQRMVSINNASGDKIIGYVDAVLVWKDGRTVVFDNKTSSIEYDENAVLRSPQLTLYVHDLEEEFKTRTAGYIVLRKGIIKNKTKICKKCFYKAEKGSRHKTCNQEYNSKRCNGEWNETIDPEVDIQILIDEIPERAETIVMENYDEINTLIKKGIFTRNFNSCVMPWGKCSFYDICWRNDYSQVKKVEASG